MKAFSFSMQRLLDARDAQETAAEGRLADALRKLKASQVKLGKIRDQFRKEVERVDRSGGRNTDGRELYHESRYIHWIESQIEKQAKHVKGREMQVLKMRGELAVAVRERKILENLKEKERKEWQATVNQAEQRHMDGVAISMFVRRVRAESGRNCA